MKLARKSLSLLMALVMLLTMASPAFAASTYEAVINARCSEIHFTDTGSNDINKQDSALVYQLTDTTTVLGEQIESGSVITDITAINSHNAQRQLVGWRIMVEGQNGHEYLDDNVYTSAQILGIKLADLNLPTGYVLFDAEWNDSEDNYHSNTDFSPFYGTVIRDNGASFTAGPYTYTGSSLCHGEPVVTNLRTDTSGYDGGVFGDFEGWVKVEWYEDADGNFLVRSVDTNSDNAYSFDDILKADDNDGAYHIVPTDHVAYLAKWSNIPYSEYMMYGAENNGTGNGQSFMQVEMHTGTADLREPESGAIYTNDIFRQGMPEGTTFATRFGWLHNFYKENASFEGFYRYVPTTDAEGNVVYNLYTEDDGNGNQVPQLYDEDSVVNFGPVAEDDLIYVAKWSDLDEDHYLAYHPIMQEGSNEPEGPTNFAIGFDIYGGTAKHVTPDDPNTVKPVEGGPNGVVQLATSIEPDVKFSDTHGTSFIYDMAKENDEFEGWLVYKFLPPAGMFVYTNATTVSNADALASTYNEDIIYVAKWKNVPLSEYENYVVSFEGEEELPEEINLSIQLGNATTVTITTPDGTVTLDKDRGSYDITLLRGQPLSEKVSGLSAELDTTDYNRSARWSISNEQEYGNDIAAEDLIDRGYDSDTTLQPLYFGPDVSVNFHGATVTVTVAGSTSADPMEDGFGHPSVYDPNGITLKSDGIDSVSDPVFYIERSGFLGWNILVTTDYEQGPGEPINSSPISSANIVNYVFPKNAVMVQFEAVWEDDDSEYFANIVFDVLEGTAVLDRDPDDPENMPGYEETNVVVDWAMRFNETIGEQLGLSRPVDMKKDGATFEGWMQISRGEDGRYALVSETPVADSAVMGTKPTVNTFYVAKWSDTELARYTEYVNMLNGGEGNTFEGGWVLLAGGGSLEFSADQNGEHFASVFSGQEAAWILVNEGKSPNQVLEEEGITDFGYNLYHAEKSFAGWNIYSTKAGYTDRVERTPVGEDTPAGPEVEYVPEEEDALVIYEGWIEDEEDGKIYDVFTIVTEYSLEASDITTEQLLAEEGLNEVYLCVARWEEAEKSEVALPDADPDDEHAIHVQQGVVDIPDIPADPNDPDSEPKFETMEQVKDALDEAVAEVIDRDVDGKNKTVFMEIKLMVQEDGRGEWREVHEDDFPDEGLDVYIPFPEGTGRNGFKFVIAHLISSGDKAGQVETFEEGDYEITDKGIKIHVYSLSPFAVGYEEVPTVTPSNPGESTPNRQNPNTGVNF